MQEFHYRIGRPAPGAFPGHHKSRRGDSGLEFRGHAPLLSAPDPRRLDLHASLRDPFGEWLVRLHSQRQAIRVTLIADLSGSMACGTTGRSLDQLADFAEALAWSAWRTGDAFAFIGCTERIVESLLLPATHVKGAGSGLAATLRAFIPGRTGAAATLRAFIPGRTGAAALADAHQLTGRQRGLVFLASDFHLPLPLVEATLASLGRHDVVPVLLWRADEFAGTGSKRFGLVRLEDAESGSSRTVLLRPALRRRWATARAERAAALDAVFGRHGLRPLRLGERFRGEDVSAHFFG